MSTRGDIEAMLEKAVSALKARFQGEMDLTKLSGVMAVLKQCAETQRTLETLPPPEVRDEDAVEASTEDLMKAATGDTTTARDD